jgi:hypothetical protein
VHKRVSEAGLAAGFLLLIADLVVPDMKPNLLPSLVFVAGLLLVGWSIEMWQHQRKSSPVGVPPTSDTEPPERMGSAPDNRGIITQGQTGDNSISK